MPGFSGFALYVPPYRVDLQDWCAWRGQPWGKIRTVIGDGFRICGPDEDVYSMAATAALRLIEAYDLDPGRIGYLALGTESSSDNAAGAVIVRGLLDERLASVGRPPLARDCEVPEIKQACLGGLYAAKGALRYLATDGVRRQAIVIAADIAEYAPGSSGEPTQGAGAVAMLLEAEPRLLEADLTGAGTASAYRLLDFRKPFARFCDRRPGSAGRVPDYPVFNGPFSTDCYVDAVRHALGALAAKRGQSLWDAVTDWDAVFLHRPYHRMPLNAWGMLYLFALAEDGPHALTEAAAAAGVDAGDLHAELLAQPDLAARARGGQPNTPAHPLAQAVLRRLREDPAFREHVTERLSLGSERIRGLGNLYTAALPAWLAAGLVQAAEEGAEADGARWLAAGYGSGDAAETWPLRLVPGWREAAGRIVLDRALTGAVNLDADQYEALHAGRMPAALPAAGSGRFAVTAVGDREEADFTDSGVAYHRYLEAG